MKYALLILTVVFFLPLFSNGAIPITSSEPASRIEQVVNQEEQQVKNEITKNKSAKKTSFFKRVANKLFKKLGTPEDGSLIFNILSVVFGVLSFASILAALSASSMTFIYAGIGLGIMAVAFGIVGIVLGGKGKGMGIAGVIVGGVFAIINAIVAAIDNALN